VHGLFTALRKQRLAAAGDDTLARVATLYLPTRIGHLFRSTEVVFVDDASYAGRVRQLGRPFLVDLTECWLPADGLEDTVTRRFMTAFPYTRLTALCPGLPG